MTSFDELTAADIMHRDVVSVEPIDSLQDAMSLMTDNHVTGLPVVDAQGRCVGVVSATDILNYEQDHSEFAAEANEDVARYFDPEQERWESVRVSSFALEEFAEVPVSEIMSRDLISVKPETPVSEAARAMVDGDVHRLLVLDEQGELHGVISSTDFVRIVAGETG